MAQEYPTSTPGLEPPAKRNTTLIVIIVVVALVLCCCLALLAFAGTWLWNNGDRILQDLPQSLVLLRSFA
jgi:hypothetical protein